MLTQRAWRVYAYDMGQVRCSSCGKSLWTSKGVCACGNPHARVDLYFGGKTHYYFQNNEGSSMTDCPHCTDPIVGTISPKCPAWEYLNKQCPVMKKVNETTLHCCPEKECEIREWKENKKEEV